MGLAAGAPVMAQPLPDTALAKAQALLADAQPGAALAVLAAAARRWPAHAALQAGLGVALRFAGRIDEAADAFGQALALDPARADAQVYLGMIRLSQGRQEEGWQHYQARWRNPHWTEAMRYPHVALWQGRIQPGMRLLLWGEQGFGDVLQFARYAPWMQRRLESQGAHLVLEVAAPLVALLRHGWPLMDIVARGQASDRFDAHLPLMNLPNCFGNRVGTQALPYLPMAMPYLSVGPGHPPGTAHPLRVGLAWQGRSSHPDDRLRSIPARELQVLLAVPGVRWVSLQKRGNDHACAPTEGPDPWPQPLADDLAHCHDFADTARIVASLDLVITIDSAIAHLAGAMDKPTWLLLPQVADWRWGLEGDRTPWYPRMRLLRQAPGDSWTTLLKRVAALLGSGVPQLPPSPSIHPTKERPMQPVEAPQTGTATPANAGLEITTSRQMLAWMAEQKLSLALTTYQIGKLFLLGLKNNGDLSVFERTFNRCMGLCPTPNGFYMSSQHQVWRFENLFLKGEVQEGYDRLYLPQVGNTTGDIDIHDMAVDADGRLVFVNTLFGCLATLSETHSFKPLWRPPFISKLAAEDRCHLNGLAMKDGRPAYVTAVSQSDVVDGWRDHRANGGVVIDVQTNNIVASGLSMPHSPRWHQGKLWLCNSGTGDFGHVDLATGRFEPVTFCAGYMRGLYFHGDYAIVGLSKPRHNKTFSGLPLDEALRSRNAQARCGLQVIDLRTGDVVHWLRMEGVVEELYDVITLPGVVRPMALGFKTDEIRRVLSVDE